MATIECTYGPVSEEVGGIMYEFKPDQFGRYVAEVWIDKHAKVFLAVVDHYRLVNKDNTDPWEPEGGPEPLALEQLSPAEAVVGGEDVVLNCRGTGFDENSVIVFNAGDEPTTFVSKNVVTTVVKPSLASGALTVPVQIRNSSSGAITEPLDFSFTEAPLADLESSDLEDDEGGSDTIELTEIIGIGPSIATQLQKADVADVRALAKLNKKEMAALDEQLGLGGRSARDDWLGQAKKLAR
jgi:predicted flap endonuclease-1-like 5' DNA nuclease